jgi:hypothetical protein
MIEELGTVATGTEGGGGTTAVAEPPIVETEAPSPGTETEVTPEGTEETPPEEAPPEGTETDGRKIDAKTRAAIAAFKKADPASAKLVADIYFRAQARDAQLFKETGAKTVTEALAAVRQNKATLDALGGQDGINEIQAELTDWRGEADQFGNADPKLMASLYEANPVAVFGNARNALDLLKSKDMNAFDDLIVPALQERLEQAGLVMSVNSLLELIKEGKGQEAYDLTQKLSKWLGYVEGLAKKSKEGRAAAKSPEVDRSAERERALDERERSIHDNAIGSEVTRRNNEATSKITAKLYKDLGLNHEAQRDFTNMLQSKIFAAVRDDKIFKRDYNNIKAKGDAQRSAEFIHAKYAELLPKAFEKQRNLLYPNYKPKPTTTAAPVKPKPNGAQPQGHVVTSVAGQRPKHEDVDWARTPDVMWITGHAVLKNGKSVDFKF